MNNDSTDIYDYNNNINNINKTIYSLSLLGIILSFNDIGMIGVCIDTFLYITFSS